MRTWPRGLCYLTRELEGMDSDALVGAGRSVGPDPVDEVLLREDELESGFARAVRQFPARLCEDAKP